MTDKSIRGRFVWHELVTADPPAAHRYYNDVFHWKTAHWDANPDYTMFSTQGEHIGGSAKLEKGHPHWLHYIGTPDLDATIEQATSLGAKVLTGATTIADDSRFAVLTDPQGALFAIYSTSKPQAEDRMPRRGEYSWLELAATKADDALHFYSALFGWERIAAHDMGPMGMYYIIGRNGRQIAGAFDKPADMPGAPAWLGYVRVKDLQTAVSKAKAGGGKLVNGPMEVPGGDWIAQFVDPQGVEFAVHVVKEDVELSQAAAPEAPVAVKSRQNKSTAARKKSTAARKAPTRRTAAKKKAVRKGAKAKTVARSARKTGTVRRRPAKVAKARKASRKARKKASKTSKKKFAARPKKGK